MGQIIPAIEKEEFFNSKSISNYREKIIEMIKTSNGGLTIADITKRIGTTRQTTSIILAELRGANLIEIRKVGVAKLHNWREIQ